MHPVRAMLPPPLPSLPSHLRPAAAAAMCHARHMCFPPPPMPRPCPTRIPSHLHPGPAMHPACPAKQPSSAPSPSRAILSRTPRRFRFLGGLGGRPPACQPSRHSPMESTGAAAEYTGLSRQRILAVHTHVHTLTAVLFCYDLPLHNSPPPFPLFPSPWRIVCTINEYIRHLRNACVRVCLSPSMPAASPIPRPPRARPHGPPARLPRWICRRPYLTIASARLDLN